MQLNAELSRNGICFMNQVLDVCRVLCAFILRQYSIAVMCLHKYYIFRMSFVTENVLEYLRADQPEIKTSATTPSKVRSSFVPHGLGSVLRRLPRIRKSLVELVGGGIEGGLGAGVIGELHRIPCRS